MEEPNPSLHRFGFPRERAMNSKALILVALFGLATSSAAAETCSSEIDNLTKTLAAKDAGSGSTAGATGGGTPSAASPAGQHPPTSIMGQ